MRQRTVVGAVVAGLLYGSAALAQSPQQCVTNAVAGGTPDAITVPLLPCGLSTNVLILTLSGANTTTSPTLRMAGYPALPIYTSIGGAPAIGALQAAGAVVMLTSTGSSWLIIADGSAQVSSPVSVANGGTGDTSLTSHGVLTGAGTGAVVVTAAGSTGQVLAGNTGAAPSFQAITGLGVSSLSFGSTGLTPSSGAQGAITVAGTLGVASGGTGVATLTGIPLGSGTSAFTAATAGTDYAKPSAASTWTAKQTFAGGTAALAAKLTNAAEPATVSATAATGTIAYDVTTQSIIYYTSNASANWTVNFRGNGSNSLDSLMSTGDIITAEFLVTQGGTAFYNSAVQVDGNAVTPKYQGGTAWSAGDINSIDAYTYVITKTGSAAFTIFASQTQFK